jgi:hypothetical protein
MALPTSYLTTAKNLPDILSAIQQAQAPDRFTQSFLESLEFKSSSDRLIIGVLKSLVFLDDNGTPTDRYYQFLDQSQGGSVLAEGIREAYADLFRVNKDAQKLDTQELINKFKTLSQGKLSASVLAKFALTFSALVKQADFSKNTPGGAVPKDIPLPDPDVIDEPDLEKSPLKNGKIDLGGMHYNIQLILPDTRDPKVFDALFRSLREHLF